MARRVSRRKEPSRDFYTLREQNKIDSGIFDTRTMVTLSKFYNKGIIEKLNFITARGKEADVYIAQPGASEMVSGKKFVLVKFFRVETTSFVKMTEYIKGDTRFSNMRMVKSNIVHIWCRKEFGNLRIAEEAGVSAPRPYMANGSILAMEFIGDDEGTPAPQLKYATLEDPDDFLNKILKQIKMLYKKRLVHADISEYNILVRDGNPCLIDFGQAVVLNHPNARMFLERDIGNILKYFSKKYTAKKTFGDAMKYVTS